MWFESISEKRKKANNKSLILPNRMGNNLSSVLSGMTASGNKNKRRNAKASKCTPVDSTISLFMARPMIDGSTAQSSLNALVEKISLDMQAKVLIREAWAEEDTVVHNTLSESVDDDGGDAVDPMFRILHGEYGGRTGKVFGFDLFPIDGFIVWVSSSSEESSSELYTALDFISCLNFIVNSHRGLHHLQEEPSQIPLLLLVDASANKNAAMFFHHTSERYFVIQKWKLVALDGEDANTDSALLVEGFKWLLDNVPESRK